MNVFLQTLREEMWEVETIRSFGKLYCASLSHGHGWIFEYKNPNFLAFKRKAVYVVHILW
jgi:hypothetical protein